jgi:tetratricopeptide (TPR) repeat protein
MKSLFIFFGSISLTIILLAGCAKQTLVTKPYHNLTGRYNAYYNANLRVTESFTMLNSQHKDNYNKLLEMYPYRAVADANSVKQPLDEAITKCARNIKLHEIGNWTDDSYHLMGQAEFLQQEYERAANTFKFIVDKYHPENVAKELEKLKKKKKKKKRKGKKRKKRKKKKRKKKKGKKKPNGDSEEDEEEKPIKYGLKHRPVRYKSMLWLAKTYIELGQYDDAGYYLRQLESDKKVPKKLSAEVQAVIAYNWIVQKEYEKAVEPLEIAIKGTKKKTVKNRYVYVLGQIYQMQSNNQMAMENFHDVLRLRPSYEMEFNARLNMATNAASASGKKVVDPEIALKRMLRDSKNEEYKDQIYFALAKIKLKSGKKEEGILALQQSLNYSASNAQRAEGALLLAELFYEKDDFVKSYAYYDSTVQVMDKNDERYATTEMYKRRLEGVAKHVAIKEDQDSMLIVGSWERKKQENWAIKGMEMDELASQYGGANNGTIEAPKSNGNGSFRDKEGKSTVAQTENGGRQPNRPTRKTTTGKITISDAEMQKSKFSLYNASLKKKGEREFEKRWNNRAWVDNWRRSDREEDVNTDEDDIVVVEPKTQAEIDAYLKKKGVPKSDQEVASMKAKIGESMYKAAEHYREDLGRTDKALELVEELVQKYPNNTYTVEGLFLAYNIYSEKNNISKATYYKNEILKKYPESNIAKVLSDPEFANSEKLKYDKINKYYDDTYDMIKGGEAEKALGRVRAIPTEFGKNYEMKARFAILEAMCVGGMKGEQDYIKALRIIVTSFPDTKEEKQAKKMIAILSGKKGSRGGSKINNSKSGDGSSPFKVNEKIKHFILIVFDNKKTKVNQYRAPLTEYNNKFHLNKKLSVSTILVDASVPTLIVRGAYPNADEAMKYVVDARSNPEFLNGVEGYTIYAISSENYGIAMTTQKFHQYSTFFEKHYR